MHYCQCAFRFGWRVVLLGVFTSIRSARFLRRPRWIFEFSLVFSRTFSIALASLGRTSRDAWGWGWGCGRSRLPLCLPAFVHMTFTFSWRERAPAGVLRPLRGGGLSCFAWLRSVRGWPPEPLCVRLPGEDACPSSAPASPGRASRPQPRVGVFWSVSRSGSFRLLPAPLCHHRPARSWGARRPCLLPPLLAVHHEFFFSSVPRAASPSSRDRSLGGGGGTAPVGWERHLQAGLLSRGSRCPGLVWHQVSSTATVTPRESFSLAGPRPPACEVGERSPGGPLRRGCAEVAARALLISPTRGLHLLSEGQTVRVFTSDGRSVHVGSVCRGAGSPTQHGDTDARQCPDKALFTNRSRRPLPSS